MRLDDDGKRTLRRCVWAERYMGLFSLVYAASVAAQGAYAVCAAFVGLALLAFAAAWDLNRRFKGDTPDAPR